MRRVFGSIAVALAAALPLGACGGTPKHDVQISISLFGTENDDWHSVTGGCEGMGGYEDIAVNMPMVLKDGEGKVLSIVRMGTAKAERGFGSSGDARVDSAVGSAASAADLHVGTCTIFGQAADVPESKFYVLDAGRRGEQTYSLADLRDQCWSLTLGINNGSTDGPLCLGGALVTAPAGH